MNEAVTTVFYDGQFWIALIEKTDELGILSVGKYTFGAEPSNTDLLAFMNDIYSLVPVFRSEAHVRVKVRKSPEEQARSTRKAKDMYKDLQSAYLNERKAVSKIRKEKEESAKFALRQEKKRDKHRGH